MLALPWLAATDLFSVATLNTYSVLGEGDSPCARQIFVFVAGTRSEKGLRLPGQVC